MPTLEERSAETEKESKKRLDARMDELSITGAMSEYVEMLEIYLLKLERRVLALEKAHDVDSTDLYPG